MKVVTIYSLFYPNAENVSFLLPKEFTKIHISVPLMLRKSGFFQKQGVTHLAAIRNNHAINSSFPQLVIFFGL